jgi:eukaryotic-like serine/threonine-protein kinase
VSHYTLVVVQNSPARSTVDVGTVIAGTYTIEGLIGRGGMGSVFLASQNRLAGKRFAIKILHAELADDEVMARFKREADIAAKLAHPNIVSVFDFNALPDGTPYLVLEYLEGETLAHRLKQGPLALDHAMSIVRQIGSALAAAHREGIVHRDLKPGNIFLVPTERDGRIVEIAKVLDFGISKIRGSSTVKTQESALLGTPQYMAPEQATGQHHAVDERTDIFALGTIVYEMLCGHPAFSGASIPEVVFKVVYEEPSPLATEVPTVPPPVLAAVTQAMRKPPTERFSTVGGFVEALTGEPLPMPVRPRSQLIDAAGSPSSGGGRPRNNTSQDAFAHTHASGDFGPKPTKLASKSGTQAGFASAESPVVSPQASTVESIAPEQIVAEIPIASPDASTQLSPAQAKMKTGATVMRLPDAPGRRPIGLIVVIAIACAGGAAAAVFYAMRQTPQPPEPPKHAVAEPQKGSAEAPAKGSAEAPAKGSAEVPTKGQIDVASGSDGSASPSAAGSAVPPVAAGSANKPPSQVHKAAPEASLGNDEVAQQLKDADAALASGNTDLAWRLANGAINNGNPTQRAYAHGIHGAIECAAHNNEEGAGIDLRQASGSARARILKTCHARNLLMEQH